LINYFGERKGERDFFLRKGMRKIEKRSKRKEIKEKKGKSEQDRTGEK
jgi:hypothetical protein